MARRQRLPAPPQPKARPVATRIGLDQAMAESAIARVAVVAVATDFADWEEVETLVKVVSSLDLDE